MRRPTFLNCLLLFAAPPLTTAPEIAMKPMEDEAGLLGWGVGALAGHTIQGDRFEDFCEFEGIFYGGAAGGGLGLAVGAHLGNRLRGSLALDVVTSGAVWGLGFALMSSFADNSDDTGVVLTAIVLPPTQLLATVLVERASGRSRARQP